MTLEEMTNRELLDTYKAAIEDLPGAGARGRAWLHEVETELLDRMNGKMV